MEDIESWIGEMENQLASDDIGRDLISVNNLIKKHAVSCQFTYVLLWDEVCDSPLPPTFSCTFMNIASAIISHPPPFTSSKYIQFCERPTLFSEFLDQFGHVHITYM